MKDIVVDNKYLYYVEISFLHIFGWITKITVFLFFIGFLDFKPHWFLEFNFFVKACLGLFLIYRFNPYRKYKISFTELDRKICYSCGVYIIVISFVDYLNKYTDKIRQLILKFTLPFVNKLKTQFSYL